ncbi:MAG: hypothetical protein GEU79_11220 [Acidimicrobiia bacterium]|nr:hypothetical protein [Acidimicrobiia bacterium]
MTRRVWALPLKIDPLLPMVCLVALAIYLPRGFSGGISRDSAFYVYAGQLVADGVPPYVGLFNRAGPLAHLLPGLGVAAARLVGGDDVFGVRVVFLLLTVAAVGLAYVLGRDLFRSRWAGVATAGAMLAFNAFSRYATYGPTEKTAMVMLLLAALLAVVHQRWATTGVLISLATLTWQPVFPAIFAGAVVAVLIGVPAGKIRALSRLVLGGVVPLLVTVAAFASIGHLRTFLDAFVLVNAQYARPRPLLDAPPVVWHGVARAFGWSIWVFAIGAVAVLVAAVRAAFDRDQRREPPSAALIAVGVTQAVGLLWTLYSFDGFPDTFLLLPAAALGFGAMVAAIGRRSQRAAAATAVAFALLATTMGLVSSVTTRTTTLDKQREDVAAVVRILPDDAQILSVQAPLPLVLSQKQNSNRYQLYANGLVAYLDDTWPGGRVGYARSIVGREPTVIAVDRPDNSRWITRHMHDYRMVGESTGWVWYLHKDVGAETLTAVRTVLQGATAP